MVTERKLNLSKLKEGKVPPPPLYQESFWKEMMSKQSERRRGWRPGQTKDRTNLFHPVWHTDPRSAALDLTLVRLPSEIPPKTPPKKHPAALHDTRPVALTSPTTLRCLFGCSWLWWRLQVQIGVHPLQRLIPSWSSLDHVFLTFSLLSTSSSPICPVSGSVWCRCTIPASQTDCAFDVEFWTCCRAAPHGTFPWHFLFTLYTLFCYFLGFLSSGKHRPEQTGKWMSLLAAQHPAEKKKEQVLILQGARSQWHMSPSTARRWKCCSSARNSVQQLTKLSNNGGTPRRGQREALLFFGGFFFSTEVLLSSLNLPNYKSNSCQENHSFAINV